MIALSDAVGRLAPALGGGPAAELAASALIEAEALGMPRFGLALLEDWRSNACAFPADGAMSAVRWLDCASTFAPLAVARATLELAATSPRFGLAAVFLRGVRGFGRLAPYVRQLADAGLLGVAGAEGPPFVAPFGGTRAVIGTNPFALAMGRGSGRVVIDFATSRATMAEIRSAVAAGDMLPEGIALDGRGEPTRVAAAVAALLPRGGRIGSLLGLAVELLAGVLAGGRDDPDGRGAFLIAVDPEAPGGCPGWQTRLERLRQDWRAAGGHWPGARAPDPAVMLGEEFERRLEAVLARMAAASGGLGAST